MKKSLKFQKLKEIYQKDEKTKNENFKKAYNFSNMNTNPEAFSTKTYKDYQNENIIDDNKKCKTG